MPGGFAGGDWVHGLRCWKACPDSRRCALKVSIDGVLPEWAVQGRGFALAPSPTGQGTTRDTGQGTRTREMCHVTVTRDIW